MKLEGSYGDWGRRRYPVSMSLTQKQEQFAREYLIDLNATRAAIRAGYSSRSAAEIGYENLRKPEIAALVASLIEERNERIRVDSDWVLKQLVELAEADVRDLFDEESQPKHPSTMPLPVARLLRSFALAESGDGRCAIRLGLIDRLRVLELIGRHVAVGAWNERSTPENLPLVEVRDYTGRELGVVER